MRWIRWSYWWTMVYRQTYLMALCSLRVLYFGQPWKKSWLRNRPDNTLIREALKHYLHVEATLFLGLVIPYYVCAEIPFERKFDFAMAQRATTRTFFTLSTLLKPKFQNPNQVRLLTGCGISRVARCVQIWHPVALKYLHLESPSRPSKRSRASHSDHPVGCCWSSMAWRSRVD